MSEISPTSEKFPLVHGIPEPIAPYLPVSMRNRYQTMAKRDGFASVPKIKEKLDRLADTVYTSMPDYIDAMAKPAKEQLKQQALLHYKTSDNLRPDDSKDYFVMGTDKNLGAHVLVVEHNGEGRIEHAFLGSLFAQHSDGCRDIELDLNFKPRPVGEIMAELCPQNIPEECRTPQTQAATTIDIGVKSLSTVKDFLMAHRKTDMPDNEHAEKSGARLKM